LGTWGLEKVTETTYWRRKEKDKIREKNKTEGINVLQYTPSSCISGETEETPATDLRYAATRWTFQPVVPMMTQVRQQCKKNIIECSVFVLAHITH